MTVEIFLGQLTQNWPTVGLVASLLVGVYLLARNLASAEMRDMRRRIDYLEGRVESLSYQVECYFEYWLIDQEWHVRQEFLARENGWELEPHVRFLDFRDQWMKERGLEKELEIWKSAQPIK